MTLNETSEDKERARRDLLHEAKVASTLGDHPNLPMIFGVVTKASPLCLVTQFHGVQQESVTLHQAADNFQGCQKLSSYCQERSNHSLKLPCRSAGIRDDLVFLLDEELCNIQCLVRHFLK